MMPAGRPHGETGAAATLPAVPLGTRRREADLNRPGFQPGCPGVGRGRGPDVPPAAPTTGEMVRRDPNVNQRYRWLGVLALCVALLGFTPASAGASDLRPAL